jgi:predicted small secreted protein
MKIVALSLIVMTLTACSTVQGAASGTLDGAGKDVRDLGNFGIKVAEKIKPN